VFRLPEILINNVKYRGSWSARFLLDAICTGFTEDQAVCASTRLFTVEDNGIGFGMIVIIIAIITSSMVVVLYCYKRIVNRSLEQSLNEKIREQTLFSLNQYQVFKDDTGRKTVDSNNL
jgi:hypothetical protein